MNFVLDRFWEGVLIFFILIVGESGTIKDFLKKIVIKIFFKNLIKNGRINFNYEKIII